MTSNSCYKLHVGGVAKGGRVCTPYSINTFNCIVNICCISVRESS